MNEKTKNYGKSIRSKLLNVSKQEGIFYQTVLTRYFQERVLYRLSQTRYRDHFFLKGGALMYAHERFAARPTLDIDFLGSGISNDGGHIVSAIITPSPVQLDYPLLISTLPQASIMAYSEETVIAEKMHAVIKSLLSDVAHERMTMDNIYEKLKAMKMPFSKWYYGHFHQSHHESIDGILFSLLDIMEITTLESPRLVTQEVRETD